MHSSELSNKVALKCAETAKFYLQYLQYIKKKVLKTKAKYIPSKGWLLSIAVFRVSSNTAMKSNCLACFLPEKHSIYTNNNKTTNTDS